MPVPRPSVLVALVTVLVTALAAAAPATAGPTPGTAGAAPGTAGPAHRPAAAQGAQRGFQPLDLAVAGTPVASPADGVAYVATPVTGGYGITRVTAGPGRPRVEPVAVPVATVAPAVLHAGGIRVFTSAGLEVFAGMAGGLGGIDSLRELGPSGRAGEDRRRHPGHRRRRRGRGDGCLALGVRLTSAGDGAGAGSVARVSW